MGQQTKIDRSRPMSQVEIERLLDSTQEELEALTEDFRDTLHEAAMAESRYKSAHARAYLRAPGTSARDRDKYADSVCEESLQAHLITEAMVKYGREALSTKHSRLDELRTLNANLRNVIDPYH